MGLIFNPRWEWRDPASNGGIPLIPPGIPGGISGIPPGSRLTFYLGVNILMFKISFVFSFWIINEFEKFRETKGKVQIAKLDDLNHKRVVFTSACLRTRRSRMLLWLKVMPWQIMVKNHTFANKSLSYLNRIRARSVASCTHGTHVRTWKSRR